MRTCGCMAPVYTEGVMVRKLNFKRFEKHISNQSLIRLFNRLQPSDPALRRLIEFRQTQMRQPMGRGGEWGVRGEWGGGRGMGQSGTWSLQEFSTPEIGLCLVGLFLYCFALYRLY